MIALTIATAILAGGTVWILVAAFTERDPEKVQRICRTWSRK